LTIILGTLGFVNFAHGAMFMLGAYAAFVVLVHWHSWIAALLVGAAVLAVFALVLERGLVRYFYSRPPEDQLLVTFGVSVMIGDLALRRVGLYFAMITMAFAELSYLLENAPLANWTGGENGLPGVPYPVIHLGPLDLAVLSQI
jgi:branched-subunit amino acid ABC-type transport system permease component